MIYKKPKGYRVRGIQSQGDSIIRVQSQRVRVIQSQRDTELEECRVRDNYTESEGYKVSGIQSQRDTEPDRYRA